MSTDPLVQFLIDTRKARGLSQRGLGRLTGMRQPDISQWERGRSLPQLGSLRRWAAGLGFEVALVEIREAGPVSSSPETGPACKLADWCVVAGPHDAWGCARSTSPEPGPRVELNGVDVTEYVKPGELSADGTPRRRSAESTKDGTEAGAS